MTKRERQLVLSTLGAVSFAISVIGAIDFLINGRIYPALVVLLYVVGLGGAPFVIPSLSEELSDHKLPNKTDDPDDSKR
jgi:hypothetical protein